MSTTINNNEINLYAVSKLILKNKVKLILIIIIGVALTLTHNTFKKEYTPLYEISVNIDKISLIEEIKFNLLNNYLNSNQPDYINNFLLHAVGLAFSDRLDFDDTLNNLYINQIYSAKKETNNNFEKFDGKFTLKIFLDFFKEQIFYSDVNKGVIKDLTIYRTSQKNDTNSELAYNPVKIKIISEVGEIETWDKYVQNHYKEANENVRLYILKKIDDHIVNLKTNNDYLVNNLALADYLKSEIITLYDDMLKKYNDNIADAINNSPMGDPNNFKSAILIKPLNIKIINKEKGIKIETKILISIILSLSFGIIFLILLDVIKNSKNIKNR
jgi:hypothetical protein